MAKLLRQNGSQRFLYGMEDAADEQGFPVSCGGPIMNLDKRETKNRQASKTIPSQKLVMVLDMELKSPPRKNLSSSTVGLSLPGPAQLKLKRSSSNEHGNAQDEEYTKKNRRSQFQKSHSTGDLDGNKKGRRNNKLVLNSRTLIVPQCRSSSLADDDSSITSSEDNFVNSRNDSRENKNTDYEVELGEILDEPRPKHSRRNPHLVKKQSRPRSGGMVIPSKSFQLKSQRPEPSSWSEHLPIPRTRSLGDRLEEEIPQARPTFRRAGSHGDLLSDPSSVDTTRSKANAQFNRVSRRRNGLTGFNFEVPAGNPMGKARVKLQPRPARPFGEETLRREMLHLRLERLGLKEP